MSLTDSSFSRPERGEPLPGGPHSHHGIYPQGTVTMLTRDDIVNGEVVPSAADQGLCRAMPA